MTKRSTLFGLAAIAAAMGVRDALAGEAVNSIMLMIDLGLLVAFIALIFVWMHVDSTEKGFRRSPLLNAGVLALPLVFLPVYLARSRPQGSRLKAVFASFAFLVLLLFIAATFGFGAILIAT